MSKISQRDSVNYLIPGKNINRLCELCSKGEFSRDPSISLLTTFKADAFDDGSDAVFIITAHVGDNEKFDYYLRFRVYSHQELSLVTGSTDNQICLNFKMDKIKGNLHFGGIKETDSMLPFLFWDVNPGFVVLEKHRIYQFAINPKGNIKKLTIVIQSENSGMHSKFLLVDQTVSDSDFSSEKAQKSPKKRKVAPSDVTFNEFPADVFHEEEITTPEIHPDFDHPDRNSCEISQLPDPLSFSQSFGKVIGACIFACAATEGPKNLRQKASSVDITVESLNQPPMIQCFKFKVYADSTIKRGKKNFRRNCFVFPISGNRWVHIMSTNTSASKKSLKWTVEKKESFLAFEGGVHYLLRIFSVNPNDRSSLYVNQTGKFITEWKNLIDPQQSFEIQTSGLNRAELPDWDIEPFAWNLSMNPVPKYFALIVSREHPLPEKCPRVVMVAKDNLIDVKVEQFDQRFRRSLLVSVPRLFSIEKVEEATRQGIHFSRDVTLQVLDEFDSTLWSTNFTYEVGAVEGDAEAEEQE
jgi:hypothetical protein